MKVELFYWKKNFFVFQNSATATSDGLSKTTTHIIPSYAIIKHFTTLLSTLSASLPEWNVLSWRNAFMDIVYNISERSP